MRHAEYAKNIRKKAGLILSVKEYYDNTYV